MSEEKSKNREVEEWWDNNPFTFGVTNKEGDQVGAIDHSLMDLSYFEDIENKFRKHSRGAGQEDGAPLLSKLVDYEWLKNKKVLDIAIGSGFSTVAFSVGGADVTGIDITSFAVKEAKKNLELRNLPGEVLQMDAQQMNFPDNSFDFVNAWGCLMHMPDTLGAISEIYRVLKPGGRVLAYMYNKSSWPYWFNLIFLRGILLGQLFRYRFNTVALSSRYSDGYSVGGNMLTKFYTPKEVKRMFEKAGFADVECFPWELPYEPDGWPMGAFPIFRYLPKSIKAFMSKRWGYGLIIKAKR